MKIKSFFSILFLIIFINTISAQDFDTELEDLAKTIATKLNSKEKTKIAVWGFVTENGERTSLGNYITEGFSVYITNFGDNFEIIDRNHLDMLLKEHQLNSEGYIDDKTAKQLGRIIAVDAIITGTFTVLETKIKVRAKVLDTETALQFAAAMASLPINEDVASYLGVSVNGNNTTNKGFNRQLGSNETLNNPETVDQKCKEESFGDFCFYNALNEKVIMRIKYYKELGSKFQQGSKTIILKPQETKCIYKLLNKPISYHVATWSAFEKELQGREASISDYRYTKYLIDKGELKVETCKSKTYTIK
jgi:TolB-like protein